MTNYLVSVVLPYSNNKCSLLSTLESLQNQSLCSFDYEIIVVDDGCQDDNIEQLIYTKIPDAKINYYSYSDKKGAAYARNFGWKKSTGQIVIFLDSDQIVKYNFVEQHLTFFDAIPSSESIIQIGFRNEVDINTHAGDKKNYNKVTHKDPRFSIFEWYSENMQMLLGAWHLCFSHNISIRREDLEKYGGFDEDIFSGWGLEDSEFAYNLSKNGVKIAYNPNILVYHLSHPVSWNSDSGYKAWNNNLQAFIEKHPDYPVIAQSIFSEFFNPEKRRHHIQKGDDRPWISCYRKFEEVIRTFFGYRKYNKEIVMKNPRWNDIIQKLNQFPDKDITVLVPKGDIELIAKIQLSKVTERIALFTY
ncbi:glycosyltransferase family 2 protein [Microbulbifer sp. JMSA004]|uniref:glycosyltransferase family 2 protein n=1 Tax=Microbulbifer sp. JMSA004 TaxID=3243370 RepID=UPI004039038A